MRIAVNTLALLDNKAGAERYMQNILENIREIDSKNRYVVILSNTNQQFYKVKQENFENIIYKGNTRSRIARIFAEQFYVPIMVRRLGVDVFFSPCNIAPRFISTPLVVTLFDLHWLLFPHLFKKTKLAYLKKAIKWSVNRACKIITISENSKRDILETYQIPDEKIRVIYVGLDPIFKKKEHDEGRIARVLSKYGINGKFILTVCQLHRRKNILRLIKAFYNLRKSKVIDHKLVITGGKGDGYSEITSFINERGLNDIIITGCIPDEEVGLLYNAADLMAYPSLYEGFGMPVIEAMACGTPVITSNVSSLPEAAGDAAILIDPYSVDDIAEAIKHVISNKEIRNSLIEKGFKQANKFSWKKAAQETLKVLEEVHNDTVAIRKA